MEKLKLSFEIMAEHLKDFTYYQLISLDQLYSDNYLMEYRKKLAQCVSMNQTARFKNYVEIEFIRVTYRQDITFKNHSFLDEQLEKIHHSKSFVIQKKSLKPLSNLEYLTRIKSILDIIFINNPQRTSMFTFMVPKTRHFENIRFFDEKLYGFIKPCFFEILSPLYQLSSSFNKAKKRINADLKYNLYRFHNNDHNNTRLSKHSFLEDKKLVLENIDFYNTIFSYSRLTFAPRNHFSLYEDNVNFSFQKLLQDFYLFSKRLHFLNELTEQDKEKLHNVLCFSNHAKLKDAYKNCNYKPLDIIYKHCLNNGYTELETDELIKAIYQLSQSYIRITIMLIHLTFIRLFKYYLVKCDFSNIKYINDKIEKLSQDNQYILNGEHKIHFSSLTYSSYNSVIENKRILENALKEEKAKFLQLFTFTQKFQ